MRLRSDVKLKGSMGDQIKGVSQDFEIAAVPRAEQVVIPLAKDIANWLRKHGDIVREVNGLCRFYTDTAFQESSSLTSRRLRLLRQRSRPVRVLDRTARIMSDYLPWS
jgi:hypothetical protein